MGSDLWGRLARGVAALALGLLLAGGPCALAADAGDVRAATVDGRRVAYRVLGSGRPVLVMISGLGDGMASFKDVTPDLARARTVIVYDRAGYGGSAPASAPRDADTATRELSGVLAASGVRGPYVLLGHSLGGLYAEHYAAKHPDQVAGLVLEESRPADFTRRCEGAGIGMCAPPALLVRLMPKGAQGEVAALPATLAQVEAASPFRAAPVLVLSRPTGPKPSPFDALWTQAQADLAAHHAATHLTAPGGGHYVHQDQRAWFVETVLKFTAGLADQSRVSNR